MSKRRMTEDWTLKLFSLGVAILLFLFVTVENATPVDVDFRVEYRLADDIMLTNDAPTTLHTTLQGPWAAFRSFDTSDLEPVVIDLKHAEPGTQRHIIDISAINPPGGMRVVAVRPSEVEITLDRRVERQVPVRPVIPEGPAYGYEILDMRITPERARVVGPASKMQTIDFIDTRTIDIMGREEDLKLEVDLRPPPPPLRLIDKHVMIFVVIGEEHVQRTFANVQVKSDDAPKGSRITPSVVMVTIKGPRRIVEKMDKNAFEALVHVGDDVDKGATVLEKSIQLQPDLPNRTQLVGPVPKVEVQMGTTRRARRR